MNQTVDTHPVSIDQLFDFFQSRVTEMRPTSQKNYNIVVGSLRHFAPAECSAEDLFDYPLLAEWVIKLALRGTTEATLRLYINLLSGLHTAAVKAGLLPEAKPFKLLKQRLEALPQQPLIPADTVAALLRLAKDAPNHPIYADLALMAIAAGAIPLSQAANLRRDDLAALPSGCSQIAERHTCTRRKYVFALSQNTRTPRQLQQAVDNGVLYTLATAGVPIQASADQTIQTLWALLALATGASAATVISTLGTIPAGVPILALADKVDTPPADTDRLRAAVADILCDNPARWFAMHLRRGVKINQIHRRITDSNGPRPQIFYPCDEIARRIGRKIITEQQPILPDIAFFRSPITDIRPLFNTIGDLAWCFKHSATSGQYAPIPRAQMELFQQTINQFTPDYQVAPIGHLPLQPGDTVIILGGIYTGYTGTVETLLPPSSLPAPSLARATAAAEPSAQQIAPPQSVIYRILLDTGTGFEWRAPIDARLLRKE